MRRRAVARQAFLTQSAAKFAEKTCAYSCEDEFLNTRSHSEAPEYFGSDRLQASAHLFLSNPPKVTVLGKLSTAIIKPP